MTDDFFLTHDVRRPHSHPLPPAGALILGNYFDSHLAAEWKVGAPGPPGDANGWRS